MRNSTAHSYQLMNIFDGYSKSTRTKGAPMKTIQFRNLETGADLETYVVVPGTYKNGIQDCHGFDNYWNKWKNTIDNFDEHRLYIHIFDPDIKNQYGKRGEFITKKNEQTYVINADTRPLKLDAYVRDYKPKKVEARKFEVFSEPENEFANLFDSDDVVEKDGKRVIRKLL